MTGSSLLDLFFLPSSAAGGAAIVLMTCASIEQRHSVVRYKGHGGVKGRIQKKYINGLGSDKCAIITAKKYLFLYTSKVLLAWGLRPSPRFGGVPLD